MTTQLADLQNLLLATAQITLVVVLALFVAVLILYLASVFYHWWERGYVKRRTPSWKCAFQDVLSGKSTVEKLAFHSWERRLCRHVLVDDLAGAPGADMELLRRMYTRLGYYDEDLAQTGRGAWWKRVQAIERLDRMGFLEAEAHVFELLWDDRREVRFAALRMLSRMRSSRLAGALPRLFEENNRWLYRYFINILHGAQLPAESLSTLAISSSRDHRVAAAVLLGRRGLRGALPPLDELAADTVKDVRREAVRSLGRLESPAAHPLLERAAGDRESQVRAEAAKALGVLGAPESLGVLTALAADESFDVRLQAFAALGKMGSPGEAAIRSLFDRYPDMAKEFVEVIGHEPVAA